MHILGDFFLKKIVAISLTMLKKMLSGKNDSNVKTRSLGLTGTHTSCTLGLKQGLRDCNFPT